jgi:hypothetical protein
MLTEKPGAHKNYRRTLTPHLETILNGVLWKTIKAAAPRKPCVPEPVVFDSIRSPVLDRQCWSWRRDLNPRPSDYKSDALPTELRQQTRKRHPHGRISPIDPFRMSGTI